MLLTPADAVVVTGFQWGGCRSWAGSLFEATILLVPPTIRLIPLLPISTMVCVCLCFRTEGRGSYSVGKNGHDCHYGEMIDQWQYNFTMQMKCLII